MKLFCKQCGKAFPVKKDDASDVKCPDCGTEALRPEVYPGPGVVIGDFLIEKVLSSGGMGLVFEARQLSLDRPVALKVLQGEYTQDRDYVAGLFREARAAAKINHPNIVQAYAVGDDKGVFYFAMELVRGKTMKTIIAQEGILPFEKSAKVICDIAKGLDVAWREQKLVHQDIKPDNIMMDESRGLAKLADLGLAKTGSTEAIDAGEDEVFGTPQYISPEQLTGVPTDVRSDIYSLGATFFQFVTGRFPYVAPSVEEMARMHDAGNLEPPHLVNPAVPEELSRIIMKMMARNIDERYQSPAELIQDLEAFLRGYSPDEKKVSAKKKILMISALAAGVMIIAAAVAIMLLSGKGEENANDSAGQHEVTDKSKSVYRDTVAEVLEKFIDVETVDKQWHILSKPGSTADEKLFIQHIGAFAVADEGRCAAARLELKRDFIRNRDQRQKDEAERLQRVQAEEAARRRKAAAEKEKRLAANRRLVSDSLRDCMTALMAVCHGKDRSLLNDALKKAEAARDSLSVGSPEERDLKNDFANVLKKLPETAATAVARIADIKKINFEERNITFFDKDEATGKSIRYIVKGITADGKVTFINSNKVMNFDKNEIVQKRILEAIGPEAKFYLDIYWQKMPAVDDVVADKDLKKLLYLLNGK